jgi:site-specific DNA-methyltransferase (adenine-specific)
MKPYYEDDRATLYRGDALTVLREMPDASVDAVVTDPPYKLSQEYGATTDPDNLLGVASIWPVAVEIFRVAKPGALCAMFYDTRILPLALEAMRGAGWKYLRGLTLYRRWGQASLLAGWMSTSDFVLIFARAGAKPKFYGDARHDVYIRDKAEPESFGHPAQKPLDHCRHLVSNVCPSGGVVLDPYMGSGTTGAAAIKAGCSFVGVELTRHFAEVAERRIRSRTQTVADGAQEALDFGGVA